MSTQVEFWFCKIWNGTRYCLNFEAESPDVPFVQTRLHLLRLLLRLLIHLNLNILAEDTKEKPVRNNRQEEVLCSS